MKSTLVDLELARNAYGRLLREEMEEIGTDPREAVILRLLAVNGTTTVGMIRRATGMPASTVTSVVKRLVANNLVARYRYTTDLRSVWLELTPMGRTVARMVDTALSDLAARMAEPPSRDLDSLAGLTDVLHALAFPALLGHLN